jgi:DNA-binding LacI/PurR family transcriptional regulator
MADVAKLAGVSIQTVSRVLNDNGYVAEPTRERVEKAIAMLGYTPNAAARTLKTGRSRMIGVATYDTTLYGPASTLSAIERAAHAADYFTSITTLPSLDRDSLAAALERLQRQGVDGILVIAPLTAAVNTLPYLISSVPLLAVETGPDQGIPVVAIDQVSGARLATQHLLGLGHSTVHHVAGPDGFLEAHQRQRGWRAALEAAGASVPPPVVGAWTPRSGFDAGNELLARHTPTAIFCANDQMTLGLLRALRQAGASVPGDISVVGFDDIPEAAYFEPPLTTVRQDFGEVGRRGLQLLLDQITAGPSPDRHVTISPEMIIRASTGPPPVSASREA